MPMKCMQVGYYETLNEVGEANVKSQQVYPTHDH